MPSKTETKAATPSTSEPEVAAPNPARLPAALAALAGALVSYVRFPSTPKPQTLHQRVDSAMAELNAAVEEAQGEPFDLVVGEAAEIDFSGPINDAVAKALPDLVKTAVAEALPDLVKTAVAEALPDLVKTAVEEALAGRETVTVDMVTEIATSTSQKAIEAANAAAAKAASKAKGDDLLNR